jgi:hypothetical protein
MLFKSKNIEKTFRKQGYIIIPDFLNNNDIDQLTTLYNSLQIEHLEGIYTNIKDRDVVLNEKIDLFLKAIFQPSLERHFTNFSADGGVFIIKGTGEKSESTLHQDWNIVNEKKYISCCVWCPLVDVDESNGCLQIIPKSNNWFNSIRSLNMSPLFMGFNKVNKQLLSVPVKKGNAVVFAHNVFHGSKPNYTNVIRPVATVSVISKDATPVHYLKNEDKIDVISADKKFYQNEVKKIYAGLKPDVTIIEQIDFKEEYSISEDYFFKTLKKNTSFLNRILGIKL